MSSIFHVLLAQREDIDFASRLVDKKISNFRDQNGTKEHPARSCREIKLDHPNFESGLYCFSFVTLLVLLTCHCKVTQFVTTQKRYISCMKQPVPTDMVRRPAKVLCIIFLLAILGVDSAQNLAKYKRVLYVFI